MNKRILVPVADGSEDIEVVTIVDVLRRAGAEVVMASASTQRQFTASRGIVMVADALLSDCVGQQWDLIAVPGGLPGSEHLRDSAELSELLKSQAGSGKYFAAICAAPAVVLSSLGLLSGRVATGHPAFQEMSAAKVDGQSRVVVDGNCITSQGPGTALEFALTLVAELFGERKRGEVGEPMVAEAIYL